MTTEAPATPRRRFASGVLPWVIATAAFALYGVTLNRWASLESLPLAAKVAGWDWQPMLRQPALFLVTFPLRWLPAGAVPVALNLFSAACAALTLACLARSVSLLPQDRLPRPRRGLCDENGLLLIPQAWLPATLAVVACGLQLTFWEHATAGTGESFDLLLFAATILCLLEFRTRRRQVWLDRAALVAGIGMAESWALLCFLPLLLVGVVWLKGLRFFKLRFLGRMALFGVAGLSLCLLLPLLNGLNPEYPGSFTQTLRGTLGDSKAMIEFLSASLLSRHRAVGLMLALVGLVPLLVLGIRWQAFDRAARLGRIDITNLTFQLSHVGLLAVCLAVAFDPPFSPRQVTRELGFSLPFLTVYYLSALCVGYYSGFFLAGAAASRQSSGQHRSRKNSWAGAIPKLAGALLVATALALLGKNLPAIRAVNQPCLREFGELALATLPPEGAVLLSDDPGRLLAVQAVLARTGHPERYATVATASLPFPSYRALLEKRFPRGWLAVPAHSGPATGGTNAPLDPPGMVQLLGVLARSNRIFYLHASYGYFFEHFCLQPRGIVCELKPYPVRQLDAPLPNAADIAANEAFWRHADATVLTPLRRSLADAEHPPRGLRNDWLKRLHLPTSAPATAKAVAAWYSSAANTWGATLQQAGRLREAGEQFALALELNPDSLPARVNGQCNRNLIAGTRLSVNRSLSVEDQFGRYRNWAQVMGENGPFDDPSFSFHLGRAYAEARLLRQAAQQFERVRILAPGDLPVRLLLADLYLTGGLPEEALQRIAEIRASPAFQPLGPSEELEVSCREASACFAKTNRLQAEKVLRALVERQPEDPAVLARAAFILIAYASYSNATPIVDRQLQLAPNDPVALINKGFLCLQAGDFVGAVPPLDRALALTNSLPARFNRAIAHLRNGHLDAAEADYLVVRRAVTNAFQASYGLGEIAYRRHDTNAAIQHYQDYLESAPPRTEEARQVSARLKALQSGGP